MIDTLRLGIARARSAARPDPLQLGVLEGTLTNLAAAVTAPFVLPYAVATGASDWQVGLLSALPLLALNASQVPGARWGTRSADPRMYLLLAGGLGRLAWLAVALLVLAGRADFTSLTVLVVAASVSTGLLTPLWTSYLGELVPEERRGRYFGSRNLMSGAGAMAGAALAASFVANLGYVPGSAHALVLATGVAAAALIVMAAAFSRVAPGHRSSGPGQGAGQGREWRTPAVRNYILFGALLILGAGMATPFYSVYFINRLGGSPETATTAIAVASGMAMLAQGLWGRVVDSHGVRVVGLASLGVIVSVPALWLVASSPALGVFVWILNGVAWSAAGLAIFSLMLAISNDANRASVVAWVNALQSPVNFGAPLVGGLLAEKVGLPVLFAAASGVLAASWVCFAYGLRAASGGAARRSAG